jgi:hypothetical protein
MGGSLGMFFLTDELQSNYCSAIVFENLSLDK